MSFSRKWLVVIFVVAFLLRLVVLFVYGSDKNFTNDDDSIGYLTLAENLRLDHGFSNSPTSPYKPDSYRTPGYPLFLLIARIVTGSYWFALFFQILLVILTAYFVFKIAVLLNESRAGIWTCLIFLFMPFSVIVSLRYLTQTLFTAILTLAAYLGLLYFKFYKTKHLVITAILIGLTAVIRPIAQWLYLPFIITFAYRQVLNRDKIRLTICKSFLIVALFYAVITPWLVRNFRVFGAFALSSITYYQLYFYDLPHFLAQSQRWGDKMSHKTASEFLTEEAIKRIPAAGGDHEKYQSFEFSSDLKKEVWRYLVTDPSALVLSRAKLALSFFARDGARYWFEYWTDNKIDKNFVVSDLVREKISGARFWFLWTMVAERSLLFLILAGFLVSVSKVFTGIKTLKPMFAFLVLTVLYFVLLSGAVSSAGLRFPVEPLIILLGLIGLKNLYRLALNLKQRYWLGPTL